MPSIRLRYAVGTTLLLAASHAAAQRPATDTLPVAGARVRVSAPPSRRVVGTVLAYRADTLLLGRPNRSAAETTAVPLAAVRRLEVSVGKRRRLLKGALVGLTGGAAAGALLGAVTYSDAPSRCYRGGEEVPCFISLDFGRGFSAMAGGVLVGAAGLVIGLAVGARRVDRWEAVELARRTSRLWIRPPADGSGIGVAFTTTF